MKNNKLNAKLKVLIIVGYTLVVFSVILLIFGTRQEKRFEDYSNIPYDEYIAITIRDMEDRNSIYDNKSGETLAEHESSTYTTQVVLTKLKSNTELKDIQIFFAAKTSEGNYIYDDYASSTKSMSATVYSSITSFTGFATSKYETIDEEEVFVEEKPVEYMVKVKYVVSDTKEEKELTYRTGTINNSKLEKFSDREILPESDKTNPNYVNPQNDPIKVLMTTKAATVDSTKKTVASDELNINVKVATTNLYNYKIDEDKAKAEELKELERTSSTTVYPEISEMKVEIYAKVISEDENLSEYVKVYSVYGFLSRYVSLSQGRVKLDEKLNMTDNDVYVSIQGTIYNGTEDSFESTYKISYDKLKKE